MRALLLAAVLVAATAAAHFSQDESQQSASLAGRFLFFETVPSPVTVGKPFLAVLTVNDAADFRTAAGLEVALALDSERHAASESMLGSYAVPLTLDAQGVHNVTWEFPGSDGAPQTWNATVTVYRDLGVRTAPAQAEADLFENRTTEIGILVLNTTSGEPDPRVTDLRVRLERWSDDHRRLLGSEEHAAESRDGAWWVTATPKGRGMVHIKVASDAIGMGFDDTPYIHQYVLPSDLAPAAEEPTRESPAPHALLVLALAALALARRR